MNKIEVFCDGGSRGNPGPAGIGVVIRRVENNDNTQKEISKFIGTTTNNQAEYTAVIEALNWLNENIESLDKKIDIQFYLDSLLVVEQINGNYKIKNEGLKPLYQNVQELISSLKHPVTFTHVLRDKNSQADKLVNRALDNR